MSLGSLAVVLGGLLHDGHSAGQRSVPLTYTKRMLFRSILIDTGLIGLELKEKNENVGRKLCI
jgi:hypothetical protein